MRKLVNLRKFISPQTKKKSTKKTNIIIT